MNEGVDSDTVHKNHKCINCTTLTGVTKLTDMGSDNQAQETEKLVFRDFKSDFELVDDIHFLNLNMLPNYVKY